MAELCGYRLSVLLKRHVGTRGGRRRVLVEDRCRCRALATRQLNPRTQIQVPVVGRVQFEGLVEIGERFVIPTLPVPRIVSPILTCRFDAGVMRSIG